MFRQSFTNPPILSVISSNQENQVVAGCIIRMQKVGYETEEAQSAGEEYKLILLPKFLKKFLLIFLRVY